MPAVKGGLVLQGAALPSGIRTLIYKRQILQIFPSGPVIEACARTSPSQKHWAFGGQREEYTPTRAKLFPELPKETEAPGPMLKVSPGNILDRNSDNPWDCLETHPERARRDSKIADNARRACFFIGPCAIRAGVK